MDVIHFKPDEELSFNSVDSIMNQLDSLLVTRTADRLCFDLSEVSYCDSAGLALLIQAKKMCKQNNKKFDIIGISQDIKSLVEFCGVQSILL